VTHEEVYTDRIAGWEQLSEAEPAGSRPFAGDAPFRAPPLFAPSREAETDGDTYVTTVVIKDLNLLDEPHKRLTKLIGSNPGDEIVEVVLTFPNKTDEQIDTLT
jgi:hypothetical protein